VSRSLVGGEQVQGAFAVGVVGLGVGAEGVQTRVPEEVGDQDRVRPAVAARRNAGSPIYVCFADAGVGAGVPLGRLAAGRRACRAGSWSSTGRAG